MIEERVPETVPDILLAAPKTVPDYDEPLDILLAAAEMV